MAWTGEVETVLTALMKLIKRVGKSVSKRKQKKSISDAVRELLKLHPDIDAADAVLAAAEASGAGPSAELFRARTMRESVATYVRKTTQRRTSKKASKRAKKITVTARKKTAGRKRTTRKRGGNK